MGYSMIYNSSDHHVLRKPISPDADAAPRPTPVALRLRFEGCKVDGVPTLHFVPRFFHGLRTLTATFPELCHGTHPGAPDSCPRHTDDHDSLGFYFSVPSDKPLPLPLPMARDQVKRDCRDAQVTFELARGAMTMTMAQALASVQRLRELWAQARAAPHEFFGPVHGRGCGFDTARAYVAGPVLAVEADFPSGQEMNDKEWDALLEKSGSKFVELRALPNCIMGLKEPNLKHKELLW